MDCGGRAKQRHRFGFHSLTASSRNMHPSHPSYQSHLQRALAIHSTQLFGITGHAKVDHSRAVNGVIE